MGVKYLKFNELKGFAPQKIVTSSELCIETQHDRFEQIALHGQYIVHAPLSGDENGRKLSTYLALKCVI